MGRAKELWIEQLQIKDDTRLAEKLGLTYDELSETEWHIEPDTGNNGTVYGYIVYFEDGPKHILDKIVGLDSHNQVWLNDFDDEDYYDYDEQYEAIITNKHYYDSFQKELVNLQKLNDIELNDGELDLVLKRQLYVAAIGTLETFLSDTFINQTNEKPECFRNFIETFPDFSKQKFNLSDIYIQYEKIQKTARKEMLEVIYHNLDKVQNMYISTFKINFPNIADLSKSIATRHDLIHRNGKTKDGLEIKIDKAIVNELLEKIFRFVEDISVSLNLKG